MHNHRTIGIFERIYSDLRLYLCCRQTYYSLKETTANINQQLKAKSDYESDIKKLLGLTKQLLQQDGLDFITASKLTELLSTGFREQLNNKHKNTFRRHQTKCRQEILLNLELKALNQNNTQWSKREIAGFECLLRTLTGCVYSPLVKSKLEQIRDAPFSEKVAVAAISDFLSQSLSGLNLRNFKRE